MTGRGFAWRHMATGVLVGAVAIAVVSALVAALKQSIDPVGLTGLYLFAIVPVAIGWGFWAAGIVAVASYLTFAFFFAPPLHSFAIARSDTEAALAISLGTAYVVSELARRAHQRAREARWRAQEAEDAREELRALAGEQAALRRVATLVAQGAPDSEVFKAVTREVGLRCHADLARMERFEPDRTVTAIATWHRGGEAESAVGTRFTLEGASIAAQVLERGRPARVDTFAGTSGPIAREAQTLGIRSSVGCPIVVGGRTWGVIAASMRGETPFPPDTEARIAEFTELVATAIANAEAHAELTASRARTVATADVTRRRIVRDLHDGVQQRLVHTIITLKLAQQAQDKGAEAAKTLLAEAREHAEQANTELRELAHGILPAALAQGGLAAGVEALVSRQRVPVRVNVPCDRFPPEIEANAYFVIAEALTNVAKHSGAESADVTAWVEDSALHVVVRDDGAGGARPDGTGLLGLTDRVAALSGRLRIESPPGGGTRIDATLPLQR